MSNRRHHFRAEALAYPAILLLIALMVVPMGIAATYSVLSPSVYGGVEFPMSVGSYIAVVAEQQLDGSFEVTMLYLKIFWRSFELASVTTIICGVIGFFVAWFIATRRGKVKSLLLFAVAIPFLSNTLIRTYSIVLLFRDRGLVNAGLQSLGVTVEPVRFLYNDAAMLGGLVYTFLPFMILPVYSILERLDLRLIEAATDLYASKTIVIMRVVLPLARPGLTAGALMVFAPALGSFLIPDMLGGGQHLLAGSLIQNQFSSGRNWPFGAALSVIMTIPVLVCFTIVFRRRSHV